MRRVQPRQAGAVVAIGLVTVAGTALIAPAAAGATQCGPGTFLDAATDTCLVVVAEPAPLPVPPPPPPPPAWNAPTPVVTASICAPIPLVNLCVGI